MSVVVPNGQFVSVVPNHSASGSFVDSTPILLFLDSLVCSFASDLNGTLSIRLRNNYSFNRYCVSWERLGHRFNQNAPTCPLTSMPSG